MTQKVRLSGVKAVSLALSSSGPDYQIQVTLRGGYSPPSGVLYARATSGDDVVNLNAAGGGNSRFIDVEAYEFAPYGSRVWQLEAGFVVDPPGTANDADHVFCAGTISYRLDTPNDVTETKVVEVGA
jgi:hypothetical protein